MYVVPALCKTWTSLTCTTNKLDNHSDASPHPLKTGNESEKLVERQADTDGTATEAIAACSQTMAEANGTAAEASRMLTDSGRSQRYRSRGQRHVHRPWPKPTIP